MKLRREARLLKAKAVSSLRNAVRAFNDVDDVGRTTTVLLHLQHAFEMLLKAGLVQRRVSVFDNKLGRAESFERCVRLSREHLELSDDEARTLRAIDALRDDEQHWLTSLTEGLLYAHCRAAITLFDDLLTRVFDERLADHLPHRVMPVSAEPPRAIQLLIDEDFAQIRQLLEPGRRQRPDARARIRSLLAMEAHVDDEEVIVSKKDVDRVERAIKKGGEREQIFPKLNEIGSEISGEGMQVTVRFVKTGGAPVRLVGPDEDVAAGAIREIDLQRKFHWSGKELAAKLGLSQPRFHALRRHLAIDTDASCRHVFVFGAQGHPRFSDNAFVRMRDALANGLDMDDVWRRHRTRRSRRS
jgi:hypothetical protein